MKHKTILRTKFLAIIAVSILSACSSDDSQPEPENCERAPVTPALAVCPAIEVTNELLADMPLLGTCVASPASNGLTISQDGVYEYISPTGVTIRVDVQETPEALTITCIQQINSYSNAVQLWGGSGSGEINSLSSASHENFNGKHLKDRLSNNRTFIFIGGVKMTLIAPGPYENATAISIYDGAIAHHINLECNTIEYSGDNQQAALYLDQIQPDGETSTFEVICDYLYFFNIYTEDNACEKDLELILMARGDFNNPNQVTDYYDDLRLDHT